jgi:hypothetical protein
MNRGAGSRRDDACRVDRVDRFVVSEPGSSVHVREEIGDEPIACR